MSTQELRKLVEGPNQSNQSNENTRPLTPLERESELVWKDRQAKKNQITRHENLLVGRLGTYAFDNNMMQNIEDRFRANLQKRKYQVVQGALKAQKHYDIEPNAIFSPPIKQAILESISPKFSLKNTDVTYVRKSSVNKKKTPSLSNNSIAASNRGNKLSLKDLLAKARQEPTSSVIENES